MIKMSVGDNYAGKFFGIELKRSDVTDSLNRMGYDATENKGLLRVFIPAYRNDILHKVDLIEDVVIGYGFRDEHVNNCLLKAIEEYALKLYIISSEDPISFKSKMEGRPASQGTLWEVSRNKKIWDAVHGYFPYRLKDIFPPDQSETHIMRDIKKILC